MSQKKIAHTLGNIHGSVRKIPYENNFCPVTTTVTVNGLCVAEKSH